MLRTTSISQMVCPPGLSRPYRDLDPRATAAFPASSITRGYKVVIAQHGENPAIQMNPKDTSLST